MLVDELAPDLILPTHLGGELANLRAHRGRSHVLVTFLPGWTVRDQSLLQTIRDRWHELVEGGVHTMVVMAQDIQVLQHRANEWSVPFPLLSDVDNTQRKVWGVPKHWLLAPGRVSYFVDRRTQVRGICTEWEQADEHVNMALELASHIDEVTRRIARQQS